MSNVLPNHEQEKNTLRDVVDKAKRKADTATGNAEAGHCWDSMTDTGNRRGLFQ